MTRVVMLRPSDNGDVLAVLAVLAVVGCADATARHIVDIVFAVVVVVFTI